MFLIFNSILLQYAPFGPKTEPNLVHLLIFIIFWRFWSLTHYRCKAQRSDPERSNPISFIIFNNYFFLCVLILNPYRCNAQRSYLIRILIIVIVRVINFSNIIIAIQPTNNTVAIHPTWSACSFVTNRTTEFLVIITAHLLNRFNHSEWFSIFC